MKSSVFTCVFVIMSIIIVTLPALSQDTTWKSVEKNDGTELNSCSPNGLVSEEIRQGEGQEGDDQGDHYPTVLTVKNFNFEKQIYNWDDDTMFEDSWLSFDVEEYEGAVSYLLTVEKHLENRICEFYMPIEVDEYGHGGYNADFDEYFSVTAYYSNKIYADSDFHFTNDYITDPEILARIKELNDLWTDVPDLEIHKNIVIIIDDRILMSEDVKCLEILDVSGHKWYSSSHSSGAMDLKWLPSGIYVVRAVTANSKCETLKYLKR